MTYFDEFWKKFVIKFNFLAVCVWNHFDKFRNIVIIWNLNLIVVFCLWYRISTLACLATALGWGWNTTSCLELTGVGCEESDDKKVAVCAGDYSSLGRLSSLRSLTLCNYPENDFDVTDVLEIFPQLERFTLMSSNVTYIRGRFPSNNLLKVGLLFL